MIVLKYNVLSTSSSNHSNWVMEISFQKAHHINFWSVSNAKLDFSQLLRHVTLSPGERSVVGMEFSWKMFLRFERNTPGDEGVRISDIILQFQTRRLGGKIPSFKTRVHVPL